MSLNVKVDRGDPTDLYEQVAGEIRRAIAEGEAKPGERLPPAKDLAAVLGVNTNTVLRLPSSSSTQEARLSQRLASRWPFEAHPAPTGVPRRASWVASPGVFAPSAVDGCCSRAR
jgi:DNA-binding transcriptional MocR family regulator